MDKHFYFHVGFMKTGTTHLQKNFFPQLQSEQVYVMQNNDPIYRLLRHIINANEFDAFSETRKAEVDTFVASLPQTKIIVSMEALIGMSLRNFFNHHLNARCLQWYFGAIHILMVIRKQDDFFESLYVQSLHMGNFGHIEAFLNYRAGTFGPYRQRNQDGVNIDVHQLNYLQFYQNYVQLFGADAILVLPYEWLRQDSATFLGQICAFIGVPTTAAQPGKTMNRSYSAVSVVLARFLNRLIVSERNGVGIIFEKPFHQTLFRLKQKNPFFRVLYAISSHLTVRTFLQKYLDRIFYIKPRVLKPRIKAEILDLHQATNRQLDTMLHLDLERLGYF